MSVVLGKNISSLQAQRRLGESTSALTQVYERLASGQRINRASDDAAGLSIATTLGAKSRVLGRASLNLGDATSLLTIADSALGAVGSVLTRLGELAEQAANGTYSRTQRTNLNNEFQALQREIRRIAESTEFNGLKLLAGQGTTGAIKSRSDTSGLFAIGMSSDGRFELYSNDSDTLLLIDSESGVRRQISATNLSITDISVSDGGDVVWRNNATSELFLYSFASGNQSRIAANATSGTFAFSADGSTLIFASTLNYADGGSSLTTVSGSGGTFALSVGSRTVRKISNTTSANAVVSADGAFVGLRQGANLLTVDLRGDSVATRVANVSLNAGNSSLIGISTSGKLWFTDESDVAGLNPSFANRIFSFDSTNRTISTIPSVDLASLLFSTPVYSYSTLSGNGRLITFADSANITGQNANGYYQFFQLDTETGQIIQKTNFQDTDALADLVLSGRSALSRDGNRFIAVNLGDNQNSEIDLNNTSTNFNFEAGFGASGSISATLSALLSAIRGTDTTTIGSMFGARNALYRVNKSIENLASNRGIIGASLSRIQTAQNLTQSQRDETIAARGRVLDADTAAEAGKLIRLQISQQAATSVLAQANQQPALALQLLR
jgi:flagellin